MLNNNYKLKMLKKQMLFINNIMLNYKLKVLILIPWLKNNNNNITNNFINNTVIINNYNTNKNYNNNNNNKPNKCKLAKLVNLDLDNPVEVLSLKLKCVLILPWEIVWNRVIVHLLIVKVNWNRLLILLKPRSVTCLIREIVPMLNVLSLMEKLN